MLDIESLKRNLRNHMKVVLKEIASSRKLSKDNGLSERIADFLTPHIEANPELVIGVYAPLANEPQWNRNIKSCNWKTAYPGFEDGKMRFYVSRFEDLKISEEFGVKILTPEKSHPVEPDYYLVPGLAFSKNGARLGRGKGFYDRYFAEFKDSLKGRKIGISYSEQVIGDLPILEHDILLDVIITDNKVIVCRQ